MNTSLLIDITVLVLSLLIGFEVISKVPATLHTPLMSAANAIHGVVVVGVITVAGRADGPLAYVLVTLAAVFAAMNVVGGFVVTDRMLEMFRTPPGAGAEQRHASAPAGKTPVAIGGAVGR
ncbi:NAD(P) transhydrogenase subunit alpha [Streptomyces cellulosae]